jgi:hypothetical protein
MSKVFTAHAVSVDGYISGRTPDGDAEFGRGLGDAGMLFDWYMDGDTPSRLFGGFKLSEPSARFFDTIAARVGRLSRAYHLRALRPLGRRWPASDGATLRPQPPARPRYQRDADAVQACARHATCDATLG